MVSVNPFAEFRAGCETALRDALNRLYPQVSISSILFEYPPSPEFGELASSVCFELAKQTEKKPRKTAEQIVKNILGYRRRFVGLAEQIDDTSIIVIKFHQSGGHSG